MSEILLQVMGDVQTIAKVVDVVKTHLNSHPVVLMQGDLGTGKTSFSKALLKNMGYTEEVSSPSFNIVNTYTFDGQTVYHFDLYRIKHLEELEEIGFMDYLDSNHVCLIEWPELISPFLDMPHIQIQLEHAENGRQYTVNLVD